MVVAAILGRLWPSKDPCIITSVSIVASRVSGGNGVCFVMSPTFQRILVPKHRRYLVSASCICGGCCGIMTSMAIARVFVQDGR